VVKDTFGEYHMTEKPNYQSVVEGFVLLVDHAKELGVLTEDQVKKYTSKSYQKELVQALTDGKLTSEQIGRFESAILNEGIIATHIQTQGGARDRLKNILVSAFGKLEVTVESGTVSPEESFGLVKEVIAPYDPKKVPAQIYDLKVKIDDARKAGYQEGDEKGHARGLTEGKKSAPQGMSAGKKLLIGSIMLLETAGLGYLLLRPTPVSQDRKSLPLPYQIPGTNLTMERTTLFKIPGLDSIVLTKPASSDCNPKQISSEIAAAAKTDVPAARALWNKWNEQCGSDPASKRILDEWDRQLKRREVAKPAAAPAAPADKTAPAKKKKKAKPKPAVVESNDDELPDAVPEGQAPPQ
jgi:hypothetical protein